MVDRALDLDTGRLDAVLEREQGLAGFDHEKHVVETQRFTGAISGELSLHQRGAVILEKRDMGETIAELEKWCR